MSITISLAHQNLESESTSGLTHPLQSGTSFLATSSSPAVHELHTLQPKCVSCSIAVRMSGLLPAASSC